MRTTIIIEITVDTIVATVAKNDTFPTPALNPETNIRLVYCKYCCPHTVADVQSEIGI